MPGTPPTSPNLGINRYSDADTAVFSTQVNDITDTIDAQFYRGAVNISAAQSISSPGYATLSTPDEVTGIVLPANGLIRVWYQATWQESIPGDARAANLYRIEPASGSGRERGGRDGGRCNGWRRQRQRELSPLLVPHRSDLPGVGRYHGVFGRRHHGSGCRQLLRNLRWSHCRNQRKCCKRHLWL